MGLLCRFVFNPVIMLIHVLVASIQNVLRWLCHTIATVFWALESVLENVCNTVVQNVCSSVVSTVCGTVCGFFCGIFGCSCDSVCNSVTSTVCNAVTSVVCAWTHVLRWILETVYTLVCGYIVQAIIVMLDVLEAVVVMILTWVCTLIDVGLQWFLCWTWIAEGLDWLTGGFSQDGTRYLRVTPKIIPNDQGDSGWFVHVANRQRVYDSWQASVADTSGALKPLAAGDSGVYILGSHGEPLRARPDGGYEPMAVDEGDNILPEVDRSWYVDQRGVKNYVATPFLYYPYKMIEVADRLMSDQFGVDPASASAGTLPLVEGKGPFDQMVYQRANVQTIAAVTASGVAATETPETRRLFNVYALWPNKYSGGSPGSYSGGGTDAANTKPDGKTPAELDVGVRIDRDSCSRLPTCHVVPVANISYAPRSTDLAEDMKCGPSQSLSLLQTDTLLDNKGDSSTVTTYLVTKYDSSDKSVGCNDLLGYTVVDAKGSAQAVGLFMNREVLPYFTDRTKMQMHVVANIVGVHKPTVSARTGGFDTQFTEVFIPGELDFTGYYPSDNRFNLVRVAETYIHEAGHQCGLLHDNDDADCRSDARKIDKTMKPGGSVRRALTRIQWCMIYNSDYVTRFVTAIGATEAVQAGIPGLAAPELVRDD